MPLIQIKNTISADLLAKARAVKNRKPLLAAMGEAVVQLGKGAFNDASKRPTDWAPRKKEPKKPHPLMLFSQELRDSIQAKVSGDTVVISSPKAYAAAHQFGVPEHNLPSRPYLPFYKDGSLTALGNTRVTSALKAALASRGL